jgi:hypothetical protein
LDAKAGLELQLTVLYSPRAEPARGVTVGAAERDSLRAEATTESAAADVPEAVEPVSAKVEASGTTDIMATIQREAYLIRNGRKGINIHGHHIFEGNFVKKKLV